MSDTKHHRDRRIGWKVGCSGRWRKEANRPWRRRCRELVRHAVFDAFPPWNRDHRGWEL